MNQPVLAESFVQLVEQSPLLFGCGAIAAILAVALARVIFFGKHRRHHRHRREHHWWTKKESSGPSTVDAAGGPRSKHRRRKRSVLNPTLAETRGLPPARDKSSAPPPP